MLNNDEAIKMGLIQYDQCPYKKRRTGTDMGTHKDNACDNGGRNWSDTSININIDNHRFLSAPGNIWDEFLL